MDHKIENTFGRPYYLLFLQIMVHKLLINNGYLWVFLFLRANLHISFFNLKFLKFKIYWVSFLERIFLSEVEQER